MNWTCPYCHHAQVVTKETAATINEGFTTIKTDLGHIGLYAEAIVCANPDCNKATVSASIVAGHFSPSTRKVYISHSDFRTHHKMQLLPESLAKPQPEYIPQPLREDYIEACRIRDLSPKASATLARRCLQGMIRDFCGISEGTLFKEIQALHERVVEGNAPKGVSEDSVEAIDHIRKIGNIGAHMGKDINVIIDVEPEEAQVLIELIETLFDEWYVARQKREDRIARVKAIADEKAGQKLISQR
ncbi:protein of unknown function [Epibacterium ulvae]|uniref:DUF4145 domain-containing protein n=1 Tax=Epibacterium ulvae TaxID=1156985 RepID=A0A1G5R1V4_9RHOB|nr:DUF4145 domain-containing protein [Epibacterium ulvae]SCZ67790.1 protein of unknown function [Epibacterium ulvae]